MFWPAIMMVRRVLNVFCAVFLSLSPNVMLWALFFIQFLALQLQILAKPFRRRVLNLMDGISLATLCLFASLRNVFGDDPKLAPVSVAVFTAGLVTLLYLFVVSSPRVKQIIGWIQEKRNNKRESVPSN
eukprot:TRINITY_DN15208_c0_g1_i1.p1 TRINITY_DN15208_c0_g1~~TRINITY_DN15208_c0_g1_i1.p1  ORF type:complete len:129 (-),score=26.20 TRINITY_DN15208_c0_g1_i1:63-449(-)